MFATGHNPALREIANQLIEALFIDDLSIAESVCEMVAIERRDVRPEEINELILDVGMCQEVVGAYAHLPRICEFADGNAAGGNFQIGVFLYNARILATYPRRQSQLCEGRRDLG